MAFNGKIHLTTIILYSGFPVRIMSSWFLFQEQKLHRYKLKRERVMHEDINFINVSLIYNSRLKANKQYGKTDAQAIIMNRASALL